VPYEKQLNLNAEVALSEGSAFFESRGKVHESLRRIVARLEELKIPYSLVGGMALFLHGYRRFTEDIDILVTRQGLREIHKKLDGLGYVRPFEKSKNLRDAESGVKIEFLVAGDYPGDGKPKEIAFPDPDAVSEVKDGIRILGIPTLIDLKIASGVSGQGRSKDLGDVEELIKLLHLPRELVDSLHSASREKFVEIWDEIYLVSKRYVLLWRNKWLTAKAQTIDEMIQSLDDAATELRAMRDDGVVLDPTRGTSDDYAYLTTSSRAIAEKYGMEDEAEFWDDGDDESQENEGTS